MFEIFINPTRLIIVSLSVQGDMRDFLNMPGSLPRAGNGTANGIFDLEPPQTPLGGRMVTVTLIFQICIVFKVPKKRGWQVV